MKKWRDVGSAWPRYTLEEEIDEQVDDDKNGNFMNKIAIKTNNHFTYIYQFRRKAILRSFKFLSGQKKGVVSVQTEKVNEPSSSFAHFVNASVLESAFNKSDADAMNNDDQVHFILANILLFLENM